MSKIYAVKKGRTPGLYNTWEECKAQVNGYSGAEYKSFKDKKEALNYIGHPPTHSIETNTDIANNTQYKGVVDIYVDGSFKNNQYSYGYVVILNDVILHKNSGVGTNKDAAKMQNVAGELSGAMNAIFWAKKHNFQCKIYHDYEGVGKWAKKEWKRKNQYTQAYSDFIDKYKDTVVDFIHVKGHSGNKYNEMADMLAGQAFYKSIVSLQGEYK